MQSYKMTLLPKAEVNYKKAGEDAPCGSCKHFIPDSSCRMVEGTISESGTCDLYSAGDMMEVLFGGEGG